MVARSRPGAWLVVVVGHQVDRIEIALGLGHLRVGQELVRCACGDGEIEPSSLGGLPGECGAQLLEQESEVLSVFTAKR